jgi:heterogeneous nuclear ribonucleoprotein F/H
LKKDHCNMGKRYVEVFECSVRDMEFAMGGGQGQPDGQQEMIMGPAAGGDLGELDDGVVRLRGIPFEAGKEEVVTFFAGLEIEENGVLMVTDFNGRASGEAFVQFTNMADAAKALEKNKESIGRRYIEVFKSSMEEAKRAQGMMMGYGPPGPGGPMRGPGPPGPMRGGYGGGGGGGYGMGRPGPYDRGYGGGPPQGGYGGGPPMRGYGPPGHMGPGGGGRHIVHMRGLPFRVTEQDIAEWFSSVADPIDVMIHYNHDGRPSGEADCMFGSEGDATRALAKNKQNMQHRYVELFYEGPTMPGGY